MKDARLDQIPKTFAQRHSLLLLTPSCSNKLVYSKRKAPAVSDRWSAPIAKYTPLLMLIYKKKRVYTLVLHIISH